MEPLAEHFKAIGRVRSGSYTDRTTPQFRRRHDHDHGATQSGGGFYNGHSQADADPSPGAWQVVGWRRTSSRKPSHGAENKPP